MQSGTTAEPDQPGVSEGFLPEFPAPAAFPGFPGARFNVTYTPLQFFTVVLPHGSLSTVRLMGFMIRHLLGWKNADGQPRNQHFELNYSAIASQAGISRDRIAAGLDQAVEMRFIETIRAPQRALPGQSPVTGIYTLRWSGGYTDCPWAFQGFCQGTPGGRGLGATGLAARKNIPNLFFDHVLPRERLSVIRVVGLLLFRSLQRQGATEDRRTVKISIDELSRLTRLAPRHAGQALREAITKGYIERVRAGFFDRKTGAKSRPGSYRIRWCVPSRSAIPQRLAVTAPPAGPVPPPASAESNRPRSEKGHGKQSEEVPSESDKMSVKSTHGSIATPVPDPAPVVAAELSSSQLQAAGITPEVARALAKAYPAGVIEQQLAWLPLRRATTNAPGLLVQAIKGGWPPPRGLPIPPEHRLGSVLVLQFTASFNRLIHPPSTCSLAEAAAGTAFLQELTSAPTEQGALNWGRRFGEFVRRRAAESFGFVAFHRKFQGPFLSEVRRAVRAEGNARTRLAREKHEERFTPQFDTYLQEVETAYETSRNPVQPSFEDHLKALAESAALFTRGRESLATVAGRSAAFLDFMRDHALPVLSFWEWDEARNSSRWQEPDQQEPRP